MQSKGKLFTLSFLFFSSLLFSEVEQEIIVLEKKISNLSGWSQNVSITSINLNELDKLDAQHPKQIFRRMPGIWISRGSGQEHLTAMRSPVLTGPGACGSFLILEDGIPVRPPGFCNVNGLFETLSRQANNISITRLMPIIKSILPDTTIDSATILDCLNQHDSWEDFLSGITQPPPSLVTPI